MQAAFSRLQKAIVIRQVQKKSLQFGIFIMTNNTRYEQQRKFILAALQRTPTLTKCHFQRNCGIGRKLMNEMEDEGVKFGAPTPTKNKALTIGKPIRRRGLESFAVGQVNEKHV
jgi:hypothetical protein